MPGEEPVLVDGSEIPPEPVTENQAELEVTKTEEQTEPPNLTQPQAAEDTCSKEVSSVSDPSLVDIDQLLEGKVVLVTTEANGEEEEMAEAKHAKKNKKSKDKLMKSLQDALKSLPPDEQISVVMEKYSELVENNRLLQGSVQQIQRQVENVQRERENMEAEHSKIVLSKSRLESLCRELQRQNKLIKDENVIRLKEEEERRKEVASKFNTTLTEISSLMKENNDKNNKLRDENQDMAVKLQDLVKQYESRETHVEKILKAKDLQCQLAEAKLAKQQIELTEGKEKMLMEKKTLLEDISTYQEKLQTMSETEITLRTQLNSYMEKYEEFQSTLDRSNKIFNTFKKEMDEMTKKIKKLEKETITWKERWEGANKALLDMVAERSETEKKMELQARQNVQLQNLCRALQEQVTELRKQNKITSEEVIKADILEEDLSTKEVSTETTPEVRETKEESAQITLLHVDATPPKEPAKMVETEIQGDANCNISKTEAETPTSAASLEAFVAPESATCIKEPAKTEALVDAHCQVAESKAELATNAATLESVHSDLKSVSLDGTEELTKEDIDYLDID